MMMCLPGLALLLAAASGMPDWLLEAPVIGARLSPDGQQVLLVRETGWEVIDRQSGISREQPIQWLTDARFADGSHLWLIAGDGEKVQLRHTDIDGKGTDDVLLTVPAGAGRRISILTANSRSVIVAVDERRPYLPDVWRFDLDSGNRRLEFNRGNVDRWYVVGGQVRGSLTFAPDNHGVRYTWNWQTDDRWHTVESFNLADPLPRLMALDPDGFLLQQQVADQQYNLRWLNGDRLSLPRNLPEMDFNDPLISIHDLDALGIPQLLITAAGTASDRSSGPWRDRMGTVRQRFPDAAISLLDRQEDLGLYLWKVRTADTPDRILLEHGQSLQQLSGAESPAQPLPMEAFSFRARDGQLVDGLIARATDTPRKAVVLIHGGPWSADEPWFDRTTQYLAQLGYAVIRVNYRGSTNRGHEWLSAGRHQWGRAMQTDLNDAVAHAHGQGWISEPSACAIGGSYGGFAAIYGSLGHGTVFLCAIALAPVTDVQSQIQALTRRGNHRGYAEWQYMVGAPGDLDHLRLKPSPTAQPPILLMHGEADETVDIRQSEAFARRFDNDQLEFLRWPDAGHHLRGREQRRQYFTAIADFLATHYPASNER